MYLEIKAVFSLIAGIFLAIVMAYLFFIDLFLMFLLIVAIGLYFMGDLMIGWKITKNHLQPLIDPLPPGKELGVLFTLGGLMDFVVTTKGPLGKREFVYHKEGQPLEASIINKGDFPIHTLCGNRGFVGHENYDKNINLFEAKALEQWEGEDIKEIYKNLTEEEGGKDGTEPGTGTGPGDKKTT